jgi:hypothetical protein
MKDTDIAANYQYCRQSLKDMRKCVNKFYEDVDYLREQVKDIELRIDVLQIMFEVPSEISPEDMRDKILEIEDINLNG